MARGRQMSTTEIAANRFSMARRNSTTVTKKQPLKLISDMPNLYKRLTSYLTKTDKQALMYALQEDDDDASSTSSPSNKDNARYRALNPTISYL